MAESIDINTNLLTNAKLNKPDERSFNEDSQTSFSRVGRIINFTVGTSEKLSGIKSVFAPSRAQKSIAEDKYGGTLKSKTVQGLNVKRFADTVGDIVPYIYMGDMPYSKHTAERFTPFLKFDSYGTRDILNNEQFIPFGDVTEHTFNAKDYINVTDYGNTKIYPQYTGSNYLDEFRIDGIIEPLEIRTVMAGKNLTNENTLSNRGFFYGISAEIMCASNNLNNNGCMMIRDVIELKEDHSHRSLFFNDHIQDYRLTNKIKPINFSGNKNSAKIVPYDDSNDMLSNNTKKKPVINSHRYDPGTGELIQVLNHVGGIGTSYVDSNSYGFLNGKQRSNLISGSIRNISDIGNRFKSQAVGFIYENTGIGNNTVVGTDSITFGGLRGDSYRANS